MILISLPAPLLVNCGRVSVPLTTKSVVATDAPVLVVPSLTPMMITGLEIEPDKASVLADAEKSGRSGQSVDRF